MSEQSLSVSFSTSGKEPVDLLRLEQKEWKSTVGIVTKAALARYLLKVLYGGDDVTIDCGLDSNGDVVTAIYAYPATPNLNYKLHTSYGILSEKVVENLVEEEIINVSLADTASPKYFPTNILTTKWLDNIYDENGVVTSPPEITIEDWGITFSKRVYGSVRLKYKVVRHSYILTIEPREESVMDLFGAVVYGVYTGGITWLEITAPPGADELANGEAECGQSYSVDVTSGESGPNVPTDTGADRRIRVDYCTQEVLSDVTYGK